MADSGFRSVYDGCVFMHPRFSPEQLRCENGRSLVCRAEKVYRIPCCPNRNRRRGADLEENRAERLAFQSAVQKEPLQRLVALFGRDSGLGTDSVREGITTYELFRGKIAEQKKLRRLTNGDIAKMTGYSVSTINAFMAGNRENDKIANAIAKVLDIER